MGRNSKLSLILISLPALDNLKQQLPSQTLDFILKDMERVIKCSLRCEDDNMIGDTGEVIILLEECSKENVLKVEDRLEEELEHYLTRKKLIDRVKPGFSCATYPDEAKNDTGLIEKARKA